MNKIGLFFNGKAKDSLVERESKITRFCLIRIEFNLKTSKLEVLMNKSSNEIFDSRIHL